MTTLKANITNIEDIAFKIRDLYFDKQPLGLENYSTSQLELVLDAIEDTRISTINLELKDAYFAIYKIVEGEIDSREMRITYLEQIKQEMEESGEDILKDNSYYVESHGMNYISDFVLNPDYEKIVDEIEKLK